MFCITYFLVTVACIIDSSFGFLRVQLRREGTKCLLASTGCSHSNIRLLSAMSFWEADYLNAAFSPGLLLFFPYTTSCLLFQNNTFLASRSTPVPLASRISHSMIQTGINPAPSIVLSSGKSVTFVVPFVLMFSFCHAHPLNDKCYDGNINSITTSMSSSWVSLVLSADSLARPILYTMLPLLFRTADTHLDFFLAWILALLLGGCWYSAINHQTSKTRDTTKTPW